ncbi:MAG: hypothetical protein AAB401_12955, partial [Acidobacteriota bacterium]
MKLNQPSELFDRIYRIQQDENLALVDWQLILFILLILSIFICLYVGALNFIETNPALLAGSILLRCRRCVRS